LKRDQQDSESKRSGAMLSANLAEAEVLYQDIEPHNLGKSY